MDGYNVAEAKAQFSELVARAEAGEEIEIKRRGEVVAKLGPATKPRKKLDVEEMRRITAGQKMGEGAGAFVRWMRDTDRY